MDRLTTNEVSERITSLHDSASNYYCYYFPTLAWKNLRFGHIQITMKGYPPKSKMFGVYIYIGPHIFMTAFRINSLALWKVFQQRKLTHSTFIGCIKQDRNSTQEKLHSKGNGGRGRGKAGKRGGEERREFTEGPL